MNWFDLIYRRLRLKNPWNYKAPLLVIGPYFMLAVGRVPWERAVLAMLAACCTIVGIAGVAYFLNDLMDVRKDLLAGRDNVVAGMGQGQRILVFLLFVIVALAPWLYLPVTRVTVALLVVEFALFFLYCVPPFRFKERGVLGILTDATYAHALPTVLATLTFSYLANEPYEALRAFLVALGVWQGALGIRNIVLHQLQDYDADVTSGNRTLAVVAGRERLAAALTFGIVPLEIVAAGAFAVLLSARMPWLAGAYVMFVVLTIARFRRLGVPLPATTRERLYGYADNFYSDWLPLLVLAYLLIVNPLCWPVAAMHLLFFRNGIRQCWHDVSGRLGWRLS